ncbi:type IV pilus assembly protein PilA [Herbaspirillum sp. Sphag1AN]|uniref:pilin n=1 Tax=unclassified Herbaspirillum TaxID=2624150 RepID=UPI0016129E32|nr:MULTISPECIES: pilin [unclassified Herbaspirillum]MBB3214646.1 type IV pilus assembly protein PilA [Herbaspirillum sp. Sphag1AN]MBB3247842.1 type IV pilus assembly protein PilA [Herbaspirillum sp. Sphag64]
MQAMQQSNRHSPRAQGGFTLIELMIVIAIVGVLAMFAVPQYRSYLIRTKVVDGLNLAAPAKMAVSEAIQTKGSLDIDPTRTGYTFTPSADIKNVSAITIGAQGVITIKYADIGNNLDGKTINLVPNVSDAAISWSCRAASVATPPVANSGTLPAEFAPENCR